MSSVIGFTNLYLTPLQANDHRPRIINMTDLGADPDDIQSMVRFLVQSNEYDVEGLIVTTGCWKKNQSSTNMLTAILDSYGKVASNLMVHSPDFPTLEYLNSVSYLGQKGYGMSDVGDGKDSPGSERIISVIDADDPRPVWICFWGGGNTLAQALWKVKKTRTEAELKQFISKIRVYDVLGQDNAGTWIAKNFPDILYIRATGVYGWQPSDNWFQTHVQSHGPLGATYPNRKYATEGDTPAFLYLYPNGLNNPDEVWHGSWGGRFDRIKKTGIRGMSCMSGEDAVYDPYEMYGNTSSGSSEIKRWSTAYNNDFQARMDWSITSNYADANHHPVARLNGDTIRNVLNLSAAPGSKILLNAKASFDPDGDPLYYNWTYYQDPGTYTGTLTIPNSTSDSVVIAIPNNANGKEIHILLEIRDAGEPSLYAYRRAIIHVIDTTRLRVMMTTDLPDLARINGGDPDDIQSMIRFLLYSNEFDVEGLIASAGTNKFTADKNRILEMLDLYDQVDENLRKHDSKYPTADYLRSITYQGMGNEGPINIQWHCDNGNWSDLIGEGRDCEASEAIIAAADKDDPRPIYIGVWGGPRDVAQAIWKVKNTRTEAEFKAFQSKLRIFLIHCQDSTNQWLMGSFPDLFVIWSRYTYLGMFGVSNRDWVLENIKENHGPLCAVYPDFNYKNEPAGVVEGDSPSFMWLISANRGLNNPEDPTQPSWGGSYGNIPGTNHYGGPEYEGPKSSISKWAADFEEEFAERADWCLDPSSSDIGNVNDIWLESECAEVGSLWDIQSDATASNSSFIQIKSGNNSTDNAPTESNGHAQFTFNVAQRGSYTLWARVITPNANDDSFWLKMNNDAWTMWNNIASLSSWIWVSGASYTLEAGENIFTVGFREDGAKLDKLYLTTSSDTPSGEGQPANNCATSHQFQISHIKDKISIIPNPAKDLLSIIVLDSELLKSKLSILDMNGNIVQSIQELKSENSIGLNGITPGHYLIVLGNNNKCDCNKLLIQ
ncbi:MAG: nucleoside hydrolase-like domain-containing protein [Bacteroidales bacterium]